MKARIDPNRSAMTGLAVAALSLSLGLAHARDGAFPPGQAVAARLTGHMAPRLQNEIMVLGTAHLAAFRDWLEPAQLDGTLDVLARFAPTRIAVERMPPDEIALLLERRQHDPVAGKVIDQFARAIVTHGAALQAALGIDRIEAARQAGAMLADSGAALDETARVALVALLLAAYEYDSAVLQWSYLAPSARAETDGLPDEVREALDRRLQGRDEIVLLVHPLAHRLGLQRLYPVDSQYEGVRTLALPEQALGEASQQAWGDAWRASDAWRRIEAAQVQARESGDLLDFYRTTNSEQGQGDDAEQWIGWLDQSRADGIDRFRYAMWELRNQRMAAYAMDAAASTVPERVLFVVGSSHKAYIDRALAPQLGVSLVQFQDYAD